jgi:hypothetical protein
MAEQKAIRGSQSVTYCSRSNKHIQKKQEQNSPPSKYATFILHYIKKKLKRDKGGYEEGMSFVFI